MNHPMFCYQCEQTAGCSGCVGKAGVCGKSAYVANLQDQLTGALIGLARAADTHVPTASTHRAMIEGLFTTLQCEFQRGNHPSTDRNRAPGESRPDPRLQRLRLPLRPNGGI